MEKLRGPLMSHKTADLILKKHKNGSSVHFDNKFLQVFGHFIYWQEW